MEDRLRRDDLLPASVAKKKLRGRVLWQILFGEARRASSRLYSAAKAKLIAERFNRLWRADVAYAAVFGKVRS